MVFSFSFRLVEHRKFIYSNKTLSCVHRMCILSSFFFFSLKSSLLALFICTLIISLVFAVIPLCHHVILLSIAMALAGKAMGVIDTIANLQLVKLYQKDSAIFLQVTKMLMCLCVCVGAVKKLLSVNLGEKKRKSLFDIALLKKVRGVTENNGALMSIFI